MQGLLGRRSKKPFIFFLVIFIIAIFWLFLFVLDYSPEEGVVYGTTFSKKYALDLELDWRQTYLAILDDLKVSNLRLIAYWDEIEAVQDEFDFSELDWQIDQATERGVEVGLVFGRRTPRWPECHDPTWLANLAPLAAQGQQLEFIIAVVEHYKDNPTIKAWQVENEPLVAWFGECPKPSKKFLAQEVELVRSLDDSRPIILTDSGELGDWQRVSGLSDKLGITLYRVVWNKYLGFWDYFFIPPASYRLKADITKFFHKNIDEVIVTELQMEPWTLDKRMVELTLEEQQQSFDLQRFKDNVDYTKRAGFSEVYLWGAEYWYWLDQQGHSDIWDEAKNLWQ